MMRATIGAVAPLSDEAATDPPLLVLGWENRWEKSNRDIFGEGSRGTEDLADDVYDDTWFESVVGVAFTTAR